MSLMTTAIFFCLSFLVANFRSTMGFYSGEYGKIGYCRELIDEHHTDKEIFNYLAKGSYLGKCRITVKLGSEECYLYVETAKRGGILSKGNGCVKAPNFPKNVRKCPYPDVLDFNICSEHGMRNAVNMVKYAAYEDECGFCNDLQL